LAARFLTTGEAAIILSVTPDTVLKWIRSGRLPARRTAGGHHRISHRDLELLTSENGKKQTEKSPQRAFQYCWEFYGNGNLHQSCSGCAVYLMRAQRCYEVAKLAPQAGVPKTFCKQSCDECEYYRLVHKQRTNVLIVTDDEILTKNLSSCEKSADFNMEIADCEYACSSIVYRFRPDFAIVDCSLGQGASRDISNHLIQDPRIPSVRVILAGAEDDFPIECHKQIFARMQRPFGVLDITEIIGDSQKRG
jgi:excisionase family DNA binding protein